MERGTNARWIQNVRHLDIRGAKTTDLYPKLLHL